MVTEDAMDRGLAPAHQRPARSGTLMFIRYVLFAVLATVANLAAQELVIRLSPIAPLPLSIFTGTAVGFILKYLLDKKWVFDDRYGGHRQEIRKAALYGAFSVFTTLVFWAFEVAFWMIWHTDIAKYSGAVLGLAVGYVAKFVLDKTFVFREQRA
jgi:putative flippase GtrA